jgi:hypothetical protein
VLEAFLMNPIFVIRHDSNPVSRPAHHIWPAC